MELQGQRIIITGAASGIGRALLHRLAAYPAQIIAVDIDATRLHDAARAASGPAQVSTYVCDLAQAEGVDALLDHARDHMGGVDVFFANAGFAYYEALHKPDWARMERIYRLNVFSPIYTAVKLRASGQPYRIVITASAMALVPLPGYAIYGSTKAALHSFAESYRFELDDPTTVTLVYPIATRTSFFDAAAKQTAPVQPPAQTPEQVAAAIVRGVERDRHTIHPSRLFVGTLVADRILPFTRRIIQWRALSLFRGWQTEQKTG